METLLTVAEVAAAMKLKEQTIRKMARKGERKNFIDISTVR
jgi:DNA-binding transcriptional regulator LsrR (DeoR family)